MFTHLYSSSSPPHPLSKIWTYFLPWILSFIIMPSSQSVSIRRVVSKGAYLPAGHNQVKPCLLEGRAEEGILPQQLQWTGAHNKGDSLWSSCSRYRVCRSHLTAQRPLSYMTGWVVTMKKSEGLIQKPGAGMGAEGDKGEQWRLGLTPKFLLASRFLIHF